MKPALLVIELHHLGDAVLAIPFLRAAEQRYEVTVYCTAGVADMLQTFLPRVRTLTAHERWGSRFRQAADELKKSRFAASVCAWSDARCHLIARMAGAPVRFGFPTTEANFYAAHLAWRRRRLRMGAAIEHLAAWLRFPLLTDTLERNDPSAPHLQNWAMLAGELALEPVWNPPWFDFAPPPLPVETQAFLTEQKNAGRPTWILHAGGRLPTKRWAIDRYESLLRDFFAPRQIPVLIVETPGEECPAPQSEIQRRVPSRSHSDLASLLQSADFLLGNDSYAGHLAAALGKRVFTIFGSGNPAWFAPFGNADGVTRSPICPHHPCIDRCLMPSIVCLDDVQVSDVTETILKHCVF